MMKDEGSAPSTPWLCVIGISGCSASGKSSIAHQLACALRSPFYPLSLDAYFDEERCDELSTYENPDVLRFADFAKDVRLLQTTMMMNDDDELCVRDACESPSTTPAWARRVEMKVPQLAHILRPAFRTAQKEGAHPQNNTDVVMGVGDDDDLASVHAHEGYDAALRSHDDENDDVAEVMSPLTHRVVFLVCEGFALFADPATTTNLFDVCLDVRAEYGWEQCCIQRFLRPPRHHHGATSCRPRLERMRQSRRKHLDDGVDDDPRQRVHGEMLARVRAATSMCMDEDAAVLCAADEAELAALMNLFMPPLVFDDDDDDDDDAGRWWSRTTTGGYSPTTKFVEYWQDTTPAMMLPGKDVVEGSSAHTFMSELTCGWRKHRHLLASYLNPDGHPPSTDNVSSLTLARYAEFRAWYYLEVVFWSTMTSIVQRRYANNINQGLHRALLSQDVSVRSSWLITNPPQHTIAAKKVGGQELGVQMQVKVLANDLRSVASRLASSRLT